MVATQDIHYINAEDAHYHDILMAVQTGNKLDDDDRLTLKIDDFSMFSTEEAIELFKETPEAIENTAKIAERCNVNLTLHKILLPKFQLEENINANEYLEKLIEEKFPQKFENPNEK